MNKKEYKEFKDRMVSKKPLDEIHYTYYMGYIDAMYDSDILDSKQAQSLLDLIVKIRRK